MLFRQSTLVGKLDKKIQQNRKTVSQFTKQSEQIKQINYELIFDNLSFIGSQKEVFDLKENGEENLKLRKRLSQGAVKESNLLDLIEKEIIICRREDEDDTMGLSFGGLNKDYEFPISSSKPEYSSQFMQMLSIDKQQFSDLFENNIVVQKDYEYQSSNVDEYKEIIFAANSQYILFKISNLRLGIIRQALSEQQEEVIDNNAGGINNKTQEPEIIDYIMLNLSKYPQLNRITALAFTDEVEYIANNNRESIESKEQNEDDDDSDYLKAQLKPLKNFAKFVIIGWSGGQILIYNCMQSKIEKVIEDIGNTQIIFLQVVALKMGDRNSDSMEQLTFLSGNQEGSLQLTTMEQILFMLNSSTRTLIKKEQPYFSNCEVLDPVLLRRCAKGPEEEDWCRQHMVMALQSPRKVIVCSIRKSEVLKIKKKHFEIHQEFEFTDYKTDVMQNLHCSIGWGVGIVGKQMNDQYKEKLIKYQKKKADDQLSAAALTPPSSEIPILLCASFNNQIILFQIVYNALRENEAGRFDDDDDEDEDDDEGNDEDDDDDGDEGEDEEHKGQSKSRPSQKNRNKKKKSLGSKLINLIKNKQYSSSSKNITKVSSSSKTNKKQQQQKEKRKGSAGNSNSGGAGVIGNVIDLNINILNSQEIKVRLHMEELTKFTQEIRIAKVCMFQPHIMLVQDTNNQIFLINLRSLPLISTIKAIDLNTTKKLHYLVPESPFFQQTIIEQMPEANKKSGGFQQQLLKQQSQNLQANNQKGKNKIDKSKEKEGQVQKAVNLFLKLLKKPRAFKQEFKQYNYNQTIKLIQLPNFQLSKKGKIKFNRTDSYSSSYLNNNNNNSGSRLRQSNYTQSQNIAASMYQPLLLEISLEGFQIIQPMQWRLIINEMLNLGEFLQCMYFIIALHQQKINFLTTLCDECEYNYFLDQANSRVSGGGSAGVDGAGSMQCSLIKQDLDSTVQNIMNAYLQNFICCFQMKACSYKKEKQLEEEDEKDNEYGQFENSNLSQNSFKNELTPLEQLLTDEDLKNQFIILLEFLTLVDRADLIFTKVLETVTREFGNQDFFLQCLEPFIMANIIKEIPQKALSDIVNTYIYKGEFGLIQKLITSIDITSIDCSPLITLSINNSLTQSLIYCCTKGRDYDFFTPLTRLWGIFVSFFLNKNQNALEEQNSNDQIFYDEQLEDQSWQNHKKCGLQALWYIRLCLRKEYITKEDIPVDIYQEILKEFFNWIFIQEENLMTMMMYFPEATFNVIREFFCNEHADIMMSHNKQNYTLQVSNNAWPDWLTSRGTYQDITLAKTHELYLKVMERIQQPRGEKINEEKNLVRKSKRFCDINTLSREFDLFVAQVGLEAVEINREKTFTIVMNMIQDHQSLNSLNIGLIFNEYITEYNEEEYFSQCQGKISQQDIQEFANNYFIIILFKKINIQEMNIDVNKILNNQRESADQKNQQKKISLLESIEFSGLQFENRKSNANPSLLERNYFDPIISASSSNSYIMVTGYLYSIQKLQENTQEKAFMTFIYSKNILIQLQVFNFIENEMKVDFSQSDRSLQEKRIENIKSLIQKEIAKLMQISVEKTIKLRTLLDPSTEWKIISQMVQHPDLQLEYIEKQIGQASKEHTISKELLELHIKLLSSKQPERVIQVLEQNQDLEYPLEVCLKVCQEKRLMEPTAYLLQKLQKYYQSLEIVAQLLKDKTLEYIAKLQEQNLGTLSDQSGSQNTVTQRQNSLNQAQQQPTTNLANTKLIVKIENFECINFINKKVNQMIQTCKEASIRSQNEMWYHMLEKLIDISLIIDKRNKNMRPIIGQYQDLISQVFEELFKHIQIEEINKYLQSDSGSKLDQTDIQSTFSNMIYNLIYIKNIITNSLTLIKNNLQQTQEQYQSKFKAGCLISNYCACCKGQIYEQIENSTSESGVSNMNPSIKEVDNQILIMFCQHLFHKDCAFKIKSSNSENQQSQRKQSEYDRKQNSQSIVSEIEVDQLQTQSIQQQVYMCPRCLQKQVFFSQMIMNNEQGNINLEQVRNNSKQHMKRMAQENKHQNMADMEKKIKDNFKDDFNQQVYKMLENYDDIKDHKNIQLEKQYKDYQELINKTINQKKVQD